MTRKKPKPKGKGLKKTVPPIDWAKLNDDRTMVLARLERLIVELYGERCETKAAGCAVCVAWSVYDMVGSITDISDFVGEGGKEKAK